MKTLLAAVNAKYIHSNPAVYSLAGYAASHGVKEEIEIAEYTVNEPREAILRDIYKRSPDLVAFSCYIWNMEMISLLLPSLHTVLPAARLFVGGPEVSYCPEEIAERFPFLEGIMCGEGEALFTEILKSAPLRSGTPVIYTQKTALPMDDLPFFYGAWDDLSSSPFQNKIIYYESSRGCPFRCAYCLSSIEKSVRFRSLDKVMRELDFFLERKVPQVKFIDRTFNVSPERALSIWSYIKEHDNCVTNFHFEIAGDLLTGEEISLLSSMRPGLVQLEIGVQSTYEPALDAVQRHTDLEKIKKNVAALRKAGNIHLHLDLIAGLPFEGFQRFSESFDDLYLLAPNELQMGFLKVLRGTKTEEQAKEHQILYESTPPYEVLGTKWMSFQELCRLKDAEEMLELYYNSRQFLSTLSYVVPLFSRPFAFFDALADYYAGKKLLLLQPSRSYRYEVLYAFLSGALPTMDDRLLRELLTYDYLLRERPKKVLPFFHQKDYYVFSYAVWREGAEKLSAPQTVFIDYEKKDPVTGNFRIARIE